MRSFLLIVSAYFLLILPGFSQVDEDHYIEWVQTGTQELLYIDPGDLLYIEYIGYMGDTTAYYGKIIGITDSVLTFGHRNRGLYAIDLNVAVSDILGIRKYNRSRKFFKTLLQILIPAAAIIGTTVLLADNSDAIITIGVADLAGLFTYGMLEFMYSNKIRQYVADGWTITVIPYEDHQK